MTWPRAVVEASPDQATFFRLASEGLDADPMVSWFTRPADEADSRASLAQFIADVEILSMRLAMVGGRVVQVVEPEVAPLVQSFERWDDALAWVSAPIKLDEAPLWRAALVSGSNDTGDSSNPDEPHESGEPQRSIGLIGLHPVVADAESLAILSRFFGAGEEGVGRSSFLNTAQHLVAAPPTEEGLVTSLLRLDTTAVETATAIAKAEGVTDVNPLVAAMCVILARHERLDVANLLVRERVDTPFEAIGPYASGRVSRTEIGPTTSFRQVVRALSARMDGSVDGSTLRFAIEVVHESTLVAVDDARPVTAATVVRISHPPELAAGLARWPELIGRILNQASERSSATCQSLGLLSPEERGLVLERARGQTNPAGGTIVSAVMARADEHPDAPALDFADARLTYGELVEAADRLALRLRAEGAGRGAVVAVCRERSAAWVVAQLAVLRAGCTFVSLDPDHPPLRLAAVVERTKAQLVVTDERFRDRLPKGVDLICGVDDPIDSASLGLDLPSVDEIEPLDLAYVMTTSGSTGAPKVVGIAHKAVLAKVADPDYVDIARSDVVAQTSSAVFPASTFEIWGALTNGAELVGLSEDEFLDPSRLDEVVAEHGVTILHLTAGVFNAVAGRLSEATTDQLRTLMFGGDVVNQQVAADLVGRPGAPALVHCYGQTENTLFSATHRLGPDVDRSSRLPIGAPVGNSTALVVDWWGDPAPVGFPGELVVGGLGLAVGYLDTPALTAERFVPAIDGLGPGRSYRTGDLARMAPSGELELLGRIDRQLKVRGFRIEPGEIEAALSQHVDVADIVVDLIEAPTGDALAAYVVARSGEGELTTALQAMATQSLPRHMIPYKIVVVDAIPLTRNGKVDRAALHELGHKPKPDPGDSATEAIADSVSQELRALWRDLLGTDAVAATDNFFVLAGDSLLAEEMLFQVEVDFGVRIPFRDFVESPTIQSLEALVRKDGGAEWADRERGR